jgi:hypothetical protein
MLKIDFRLPTSIIEEAIGRSEAEHSEIGSDWLSVRPFPKGESRTIVEARLTRLCESAYQYAQTLAPDSL